MKPSVPDHHRRTLLKTLAGFGLALTLPGQSTLALPGTAIHKPIPSTGELLPVIGMGSSRTFDVPDSVSGNTPLLQVLATFFANGGALIDSSPMYGNAEQMLGSLLARLPDRDRLFAATKVWTDGRRAGIEQMQRSSRRMGIEVFDLMQIHNLRDWDTHLETLKAWKAEGRIRYIGITTSHGRAHHQLARILESEPFDFVQFSYNIANREVEQRLLPLAAERGIATLINRPFQGGRLFTTTAGRPLPAWCGEFDCHSWAQFLLKYVVSHPAVCCAIPATSKARHMLDNMGAGFGRLPDRALRRKMETYFASL